MDEDFVETLAVGDPASLVARHYRRYIERALQKSRDLHQVDWRRMPASVMYILRRALDLADNGLYLQDDDEVC